jgi:hypothetical protein
MVPSVVFKIEGIDVAVKNLRRKMQRLDNFRDPLHIVAEDFYKLQRRWMDSEGGGHWPGLNPRYASWKIKRVGDKPILQFSGAMYDDLTGRTPDGLRITASRVTIRATKSGSRWKWHTEGSSAGNKSGQERKRRQVISPAMRIRKQYWASLLARWVAGQTVRG